ncbi:hypothetical protein DBV05_g495 [Lasiodiplodia theobromae]|uniref:Uncharacterized protein n=1 Tax=Lasiodiplodia theobromae TaxID=45133 RepID=A0A5N5DSV7_9PEZI|nr:hypothetical protein DBV05_g495 [Lasiodiplodia theobromae]
MPAQYKAPISRDTIVEVVEKNGNGLNKRTSKLGDELEHRDDDRLRLIFADPQIPHKDLKSLENLLPWGFRKMIGRTAGGGTGCCTSLANGRVEHVSWFFFLWQVLEGVESTSRGPRPCTRWSYIDVLISWNSETNVTMVLYLGDLGKMTSSLRSKLEAAVRSGEVWRDPYAWHRLIIDEVDEIYNDRVWALQEFIGRVESDRSPDFYDFDLMHDIGRLLIQSNECETASRTRSILLSTSLHSEMVN